MPIFIKYDGVQGDVTSAGHEGWSAAVAPGGLAAVAPGGLAADATDTTAGYGDPEYKYVPVRRSVAAEVEDAVAGGRGRDLLVGGAGGDATAYDPTFRGGVHVGAGDVAAVDSFAWEGGAAGTGLAKVGTGTLVLANDGAALVEDGVHGRDVLAWQRGGAPAADAGGVGGGDLGTWQDNYGVGPRAATGDDVVVDGRIITGEDPAAVQHELGHTLGFRHEHVGATTTRIGGGGDDILVGGRTGFDDAAGTSGVFLDGDDLGEAAAAGISRGVTVLAWARVDGAAPDADATGGILAGMGDGSVRSVAQGVDPF